MKLSNAASTCLELRRRRRRCVWPDRVAPLLFFAMALVICRPVVSRFSDSVPLGSENAASVPLLNVWTIWCNGRSLERAYAGYWQAPILHPARDTFAFSEPMPATAMLWPIERFGGPAAAYNLALLVSLALNGTAAFSLTRSLRFRRGEAMAAGGMATVLPFVFAEFGVLQLVPIFPSIWTLHSTWKLCRKPSLARSAILAAAVTTTYFCCSYYGLFLVTLLAAVGLIPAWQREPIRMARVLAHGVIAAALAAALIGPVAWGQRRSAGEHQLRRPVETVRRFSATGTDYLATPFPWFGMSVERHAPNRSDFAADLNAGWLKFGLAGVGASLGIASRRRRRWTLFLLLFGVAAAGLSLGPAEWLGDLSPYEALRRWFPGYEQIRSPFRFGAFVQVAVVLLAPVAVERCRILATRRFIQKQRLRRVALAFIGIVSVAAVVELWPTCGPLYSFPEGFVGKDTSRWADWLRAETPSDAVIVCIPLSGVRTVAGYEADAVWMLWQTRHARRMVNGYSGFLPQENVRLRERAASFPDATSLSSLAGAGVEYCVVRRGGVLNTAGVVGKEGGASLAHITTASNAATANGNAPPDNAPLSSAPSDTASTLHSISRVESGEWSLRQVFSDDASGVDVYRIVHADSANTH